MSTFGCNGVVLKHSKLNDSDKLVKILTQNQGLIDVVVKGARKINSKKGGSIDLFNLVSIQVARGKSLGLVTEALIIRDYLQIKNDLFKIGLVYYLSEVLISAEYEDSECELIFNALEKTLEKIDTSSSKLRSVIYLKAFEVYLLNILGFKIPVDDLGDLGEILGIIESNDLQKLSEIEYNTKIIKKLSDYIQNYTETVLDRKFRKVNLLV